MRSAPRRAVALCCAAALFGCSPPRVWLPALFVPVLEAWDGAHLLLDPHREASQTPVRRDARPLRAQAEEMTADLRKRFLSGGGTLLRMRVPTAPLGDMCLWQGVYAAYAALQNVVEPSEENRRFAEGAFDGLARHGERGRPLIRAVLPASVPAEPGGRSYYKDAAWQWKEDASIDSAAGWVFGCVVALEHLPSRRAEALAALERFADGLRRSGWVLRNSDGSRTRFGAMGGAAVNSPVGLLSTLAALQALARHGRDARFARDRDRFLAEGQARWAAYASGPVLWRNKTTNHNIAYLGLASILLVEDDPERRRLYARGLARLDRLTGKMGNPFWLYLSDWALAQGPVPAAMETDPLWAWRAQTRRRRLASAKAAMQEWDYPRNKKVRDTRNSERGGLEYVRWPPFGRSVLARPLPVWQRPPADFLWQRSPYLLDDWTGLKGHMPESFAPLDFLAAYTLGRLTGALGPDE